MCSGLFICTYLFGRTLINNTILAAIRDDKAHPSGWYKLDTTALQR